MEEPEVDDDGG